MEKEMITQTALLERGWTKSMITKLLPDPVLKNNPYNRSSSIKLWELETIEQIEKQPYFMDAKKATECRLQKEKTELSILYS